MEASIEHSVVEELAEDGFTEKTVKRKSELSVSEAVLYKKVVVAVSRREVATNSSRHVSLGWQDAEEETRHPCGRLQGQETQRRCERERSGVEKQ